MISVMINVHMPVSTWSRNNCTFTEFVYLLASNIWSYTVYERTLITFMNTGAKHFLLSDITF